MTYELQFFYRTASATAYGQGPKFVMAEHLATAEGENCSYGPTLYHSHQAIYVDSYNLNTMSLEIGNDIFIAPLK
jgi:hypothetical protein